MVSKKNSTAPLTSLLSNGLKRIEGWLFLAITALIVHIVAYIGVRYYYATHLPHYDSIGSYTVMFQIIQTYRQHLWDAALTQAIEFDLSWLQSFFALLSATFLTPTPAALQLYNSLAMLILMGAIFSAAKSLGSSDLKAYLISLICFIPDAFWSWQGGFTDLRRDFAFVALLGATYFLWFSFQWRPSWPKSYWLGLIASFTVLSRSNAIFLVIVLMFPIMGISIAYRLWTKDYSFLKRLIPAFLIFSSVTGLNLYTIYGETVSRYQNLYVAYGIGGTRWESIAAHWNKPLLLMFGRLGQFSDGAEGTALITLGSFIFGSICLIFLTQKGVVTFNWKYLANRRTLWLTISGSWIIFANLFLMCVLVVVRPLNFEQTKFMFYPSIIGFISFLFTLLIVIKVPYSKFVAHPFTSLVCIGILLISFTRTAIRTPDVTPDYVNQATRLAEVLATGSSLPIAFLWHEVMSLDTLAFYLAQANQELPNKFFYRGPQGEKLDFAITTPPETDIVALQKSIQTQIKQGANLVVINDDPNEYDISSNPLFIFQYGKPIVEALKSDPQFEAIYQFSLSGIWSFHQNKLSKHHFLVLKNTYSDSTQIYASNQ